VSEESGYFLENSTGAAGRRLTALAALFDPWTFTHLDSIGLGPGWKCWEVGAGGSSVIRGLSERVGPTGTVLATDIDIRWAAAGSMSNVTVLQRDVATDEPSDTGFDLVHARLVLVHVTDRDRALINMISALRPGGWLVVEDADPGLQPLSCLEPTTEQELLANRIRTGFRSLMAERGADLAYGRKLPTLLRKAGLIGVRADAYFPVSQPECAILELATISIIRDQLILAGIVTAEEVDRHCQAVADGLLDIAQPPLICAWGQCN